MWSCFVLVLVLVFSLFCFLFCQMDVLVAHYNISYSHDQKPWVSVVSCCGDLQRVKSIDFVFALLEVRAIRAKVDRC